MEHPIPRELVLRQMGLRSVALRSATRMRGRLEESGDTRPHCHRESTYDPRQNPTTGVSRHVNDGEESDCGRRRRRGVTACQRYNRMHGLLMDRADALMGCTENSPEEAELAALTDLIEAHERQRWPEGKIPGGKG